MPRSVTIADGTGAKTPFKTTAGTVSGLLAERHIVLGPDDVSVPSGDTPLVDGTDVQVVRNGVGEVVETHAAPPPVQKIDDPTLPRGKEVVVNPGQARRGHRDHEDLRAERRRGPPRADRGRCDDRRGAARGEGRARTTTSPPRPPSTMAASGTASPSARPPATGASAPATATTAACSSTRAPGGPSAVATTRPCPAGPAARSRSRSRRRCATPAAAATAPGPPARASSACPSDV